MSIEENSITIGDCLEVMPRMECASADLIIVDPPYNLGLKYDGYNDSRKREDYLNWTYKWISVCVDHVLKPNGSMFVFIGDEYAAEMKIALDQHSMAMRNWLIWRYGFGNAQQSKFTPSHTHILYFVKDRNNFTFNADAVRVQSERQKSGDKRANPKGKLPDDTWEFSRLCGTFNERVKGSVCQTPEALVECIICASSNEGDMVLDPMCHVGSVPAVAKKLGRRYIGIELSPNYAELARERLAKIEG